MKIGQMIPSPWVHKDLQFLFCIQQLDRLFYRKGDDCGDIIEMERRIHRKTAVKLYEVV